MKIPIRKRPELTTLPKEHIVLKVSELPAGLDVLRINTPFTLTHLSQCFDKAFINAGTSKSLMTILGAESAKAKRHIKELEKLVLNKYPYLRGKIYLSANVSIRFSRSHGKEPDFVIDLKRIVHTFKECGFSDVPLRSFSVRVKTEHGIDLVTFNKRGDLDGFVLSALGRKTYLELKSDELRELIEDNEGLRKAKAHICTAKVNIGKWLSCEV